MKRDKSYPLGKIVRFKARFVTKLYSQVAGVVDFNESFASKVKFIIIDAFSH